MNKYRKARLEKGMTQKEVSDAAGVSLNTIVRIESGQNIPRFRTQLGLNSALDIGKKHVGKVPHVGKKQFSIGEHPDWIALHSKKAQLFLGWDQEGNERYSWTTRQAGEAMLKTMKKYKCYPKDQLGLFATMCGGKVEPHLLQEWCDFIKKIRSK